MSAYLDHAGMGVLSPATIEAMRTALDEVYPYGAARMGRIFPARGAARIRAAQLLDCDPGELAFVPNTSTGIHLVADGLAWRTGEEIVVFDRDFPANVHPWRALAQRCGVVLSWVPMRGGGYDLADVAAAITPRTRLIAVSHVNFATGFRIDLDALCALAAPVGALVCVDAVQSLGAMPLSLARTPIDFLAAGAHKWLSGPPGTGIFFCRADRLELLRSVPAGWFGYDGANDMLTRGPGHFRYDLPLRPVAAQVEGGMYDILGLVGLSAALDDRVAVGIDAVSAGIARHVDRLRGALADLGYRIESPAGAAAASGIISFTDPRGDSALLAEKLAAQDIHVSYPDGKIRVSPHHSTPDADIEALIKAVDDESRHPHA